MPPCGQKVYTTSIYNRRRRVRWQGDRITISAMRDFPPSHADSMYSLVVMCDFSLNGHLCLGDEKGLRLGQVPSLRIGKLPKDSFNTSHGPEDEM